uniref:Reverse transcriptase Ty1/copia-type domain-containing protein n=1 Tax=Solanum lycopersicum TaxID=4081 RepID=A0A3Q7GIF1_SOLLC
MKDLGYLSYFLGIDVTRHAGGLFLSKKKYTTEIIERAEMSSCKGSPTPVDTKSMLDTTMSKPFENPALSCQRTSVCLFMHDSREEHMHALKHILRYIHGTMDFGLHIFPSSTSTLILYTDSDWGGCLDTRRSATGYCVFLGDNLIFWSAKRQATLSHSSAEAEYRGVANIAHIFTKGLPLVLFEDFWDSLSI